MKVLFKKTYIKDRFNFNSISNKIKIIVWNIRFYNGSIAEF